jgi:hypothetical protein
MTVYQATSATPEEGPPWALPLPPGLLQALQEALRTIRYGTVELVIHDGRVVQLERREKVRFEPTVTEKHHG